MKNRRIMGGILPLLLLILFSTSLYSRKACLIVAISQYENPNIPNIRGPDVDGDYMKEIAHILGYKDGEIVMLKDAMATRERILNEMRKMADQATSDDAIALFISSHGTQVRDVNGDEPDSYDEAIVPYDTYSMDDVITDDQIHDIFANSKARLKLFIFDTCHSGDAIKSIPGGMLKDVVIDNSVKYVSPRILGMKAIAVVPPLAGDNTPMDHPSTLPGKVVFLSASASNEVAHGAVDGIRASLFTYALHRGIVKGLADYNHDGKVTFYEAWMYSNTYCRDSISGVSQSPQLYVEPNEAGKLVVRNVIYWMGTAPVPDMTSTNNTQQLLEAASARSNFRVYVTSRRQSYRMGELISFTIKSPISGYVNIVAVEPNGDIHLLFPNEYSKNNHITAGNYLRIPQDIGGFRLKAVEPRGESKLYVFVTEKNVDLWDYLHSLPINKGIQSPFLKVPGSAKGIQPLLVEAAGGHSLGNSNKINFGAAKISIEVY